MSSIRRSGLLLEAASRTQHLHWVHRKHLKLSAPETYVTRPLVAQDKPLALPWRLSSLTPPISFCHTAASSIFKVYPGYDHNKPRGFTSWSPPGGFSRCFLMMTWLPSSDLTPAGLLCAAARGMPQSSGHTGPSRTSLQCLAMKPKSFLDSPEPLRTVPALHPSDTVTARLACSLLASDPCTCPSALSRLFLQGSHLTDSFPMWALLSILPKIFTPSHTHFLPSSLLYPLPLVLFPLQLTLFISVFFIASPLWGHKPMEAAAPGCLLSCWSLCGWSSDLSRAGIWKIFAEWMK